MARLKQIEKLTGAEAKARAAEWRKNLASKMTELRLSQSDLATLVKKRFAELGVKTTTEQKNVSSWTHVGEDVGGTTFPRYEDMLQIAHVLGVSVEFLTGETQYDSKRAEAAAKHLGLSNEAIRALRSIATEFDSSFAKYYMGDDAFDEEAVQLLNAVFVSSSFMNALIKLKHLNSVRNRIRLGTLAFERVEDRHGKEMVEKGWYVHRCKYLPYQPYELTLEEYWEEYKGILVEGGISFDELHEVLVIANELDDAIDKEMTEVETAELIETAFRYEAKQAFGELVDELYPQDEPVS